MIKVKVVREGERVHSFSLSGHADFARKGQDIVCAGVSAVAFGSVNAILSLTNVKPKIDQAGKEGGYLEVTFPVTEEDEKVQLLIQAMLVSLQTIERDYGKYMKIINS